MRKATCPKAKACSLRNGSACSGKPFAQRRGQATRPWRRSCRRLCYFFGFWMGRIAVTSLPSGLLQVFRLGAVGGRMGGVASSAFTSPEGLASSGAAGGAATGRLSVVACVAGGVCAPAADPLPSATISIAMHAIDLCGIRSTWWFPSFCGGSIRSMYRLSLDVAR